METTFSRDLGPFFPFSARARSVFLLKKPGARFFACDRVEASSLGLMVNEKFVLGPPGFGARFEWDGTAGPHMRRVMLKLVLPAMETYVQVTHG